jgi:molecular chaperone Hsp33
LPGEGGTEGPVEDTLETWNRTVALASTLHQKELLQTDIDTLLRRLFWEETIRAFEPRHPEFHCTCSREKVGNMLKMLGRPEVDSAVEEMGKLGVNCDFCGRHYEFDKVDCAQLFATETAIEGLQPPGQARH